MYEIHIFAAMKRILTITICLIMATLGFAQDLDSLFNIYKDAPRKEKKAAAEQLLQALIAQEITSEDDTLALQGDDDYLAAKLYIKMAGYRYGQGDYAEALAYTEDGLPFVPADSTNMLDNYYSYVSVLAFYMNDYQKALEACEQRLTLIPADDKEGRASVCNTLASIYKELATDSSIVDTTGYKISCEENALRYSQEAVALRRELGNDEKGLLAAFLGKQSEILSQLVRTDEALAVIDEAIALDLEAGRMERYYQRLAQKGHVFLMQNRYQEAHDVYLEAIEHTDKKRNPSTYKTLLYQLACSEIRLNDKKAAAAHLKEYQEMERNMNTSPNPMSYGYLAICYQYTDPLKAYDYLMEYTKINDSVRDANLMKQFNEFQVKYETAERERQIAEQQNLIERRGMLIRMWIIIAAVLIAGLIVIAVLAARYRRRGRELQHLNDTKSRLFSIISHDLKNPVQAQKRVIDLMADGATMEHLTPSDVQQSCTMLKQSSDSVNDMLLNLLQWASLEMGKTTCTPTSIDLNAVVNPIVNQLKLQAAQKEVTLKVVIPEGTYVTADSNLLQTIIRNLVSNAIKFSNTGGAVDVYAEPEGKGCRISVADHGVGMSEEKAHSLFNLNTRSSAGTLGEKGTGLGLFVCQELAHRMGTSIEVESHIGEGSRFSLFLSD